MGVFWESQQYVCTQKYKKRTPGISDEIYNIKMGGLGYKIFLNRQNI
jgi:hypothetical protein